jgi:hypothetical protein
MRRHTGNKAERDRQATKAAQSQTQLQTSPDEIMTQYAGKHSTVYFPAGHI